jgi:hypothetical protein
MDPISVHFRQRLEVVAEDIKKAKSEQIAFSFPLDLYPRSPDPGELQYKPRGLKKVI